MLRIRALCGSSNSIHSTLYLTPSRSPSIIYIFPVQRVNLLGFFFQGYLAIRCQSLYSDRNWCHTIRCTFPWTQVKLQVLSILVLLKAILARAGVSLKTSRYRTSWPTLRIDWWPDWFGCFRKRFSYKGVQFKTFFMPEKTHCLPSENVNETPATIRLEALELVRETRGGGHNILLWL